MNHCAIQQGAFAACEDMWSSVSSISDKRDAVVCPKPRRLGLLNATITEPIRPLRWHVSHQQELCDSRAGADLLDIILAKGGGGADQSSAAQVASSPPFFCGSPPSRVSNPLIQDARFGDEKVTPVSPRAIPIPSGLASSPSASTRKGGCVRANFGNNPAVRVEGFACRHSLKGHTKPIHSVCWDPSGELLASVSEDSVRVWTLRSGSEGDCLHELSSNGNKFHSCVFHPAYSSLLVIGCYQSLELWNMNENKTMTLTGHEGLIASLAVSGVAGLVASASHDKFVKLWK